MLNPEDLSVESFETVSSIAGPGGYCCTGCDSGCGYNPTASGCASASDGVFCMEPPLAC